MAEKVISRLSFKIGGEAGQGVESSGAGFAKALARGGLHIFAYQDYMSRIRGGHNFFQIRVAERPIYSHTDEIELLLALTAEAVERHLPELVPGGGIIADEELKLEEGPLADRGVRLFRLPLARIALEEGGSRVMLNTAALGAAAGLTNYKLEHLESVIEDNFKVKGTQIVRANLAVVRAAYEYAQQRYAADFGYELKGLVAPKRMVLSGNTAICLGAVAAGCRFLAAYPMTPTTGILEWFAGHAGRLGLVFKQTEDEIAAITMAIGAAHMGLRAMCATSGGGFSLMVEALGLAGMTETPLVIVEGQRPGPSTGLPTKTEQGDLLFVIHASQGEFPRIVLTPGTAEEAFWAGAEAFNLAERYQCPVIILSDHFLGTSLRTVEPDRLKLEDIRIDRGELLTPEELDRLEDYKRFRFTETGISPRALPGHPKAVYVATGDEHAEDGRITEDPLLRRKMVEKRMKKLELARRELPAPGLYGHKEAELTFVAWGSTLGPLRETVERLNSQGRRVRLLHFRTIWPFPEGAEEALAQAKHLIAVEGNYSGQLAGLIRRETGLKVEGLISKYDGLPFSPGYILEKLRELEEVKAGA
ncbi:MAG: 2-oxoacid:acceptor oxidoreductase subunit alpha [Candidatus Acetothermia bacterium]|jgi:2-oxoglutarate ferredoxin oxidoreductase subunit alpha|nr:2-oxoacid:acceptor oxidoreductase subunit alpha [Candidatus Acetothermia bacterium]MDH7505800.1 2-oxoacid:acceptor oxidoreductase subunit alpha [Candidatus Acetothermia bacterium]